MVSPDFGKSVRTMVRALTFITDTSDIDVVPTVAKEIERSIQLD